MFLIKVNPSKPGPREWTFLSNHAHVLLCISRDPDARVRDISAAVGITNRAVQRILGELDDAGIIRRCRFGRRTHYEVNRDIPLRHRLEGDHTVGDLIALLKPPCSTRH